MDGSGFQSFNLGGLGQGRAPASGNSDRPQSISLEQLNYLFGRGGQGLFGNAGPANQEGLFQQLQNMAQGQSQGGMAGFPFASQGGLQNPLAAFGNNFPGMGPGNTTEEPEEEEEIDWDQVFEEVFFPNGHPDDEERMNRFREHNNVGERRESRRQMEGTETESQPAIVLNVRSQENFDQTDGAQAAKAAKSREDDSSASNENANDSDKKRKRQTFVKEKKLKSRSGNNSRIKYSSETSEDTSQESDDNVPQYTLSCDFTELVQKEKEKALTFEDPHEDAQCTIILLDSSYSMREQPMETAYTAIRSFITGLSDIPDLKENVALVTYGEDLCVHQHLTCDYGKVFEALDGVRICGEASLSHGLALCVPVLERLTKPAVNGVVCYPRIMIVSAFKMTVVEDDKTVSQKLVRAAKERVKNLQESYGISVFCIPVDKTYQMVATQIARVGDGMVVSPGRTNRLCSFYLQRLLAGNVLGDPEKIITDETIHSIITSLQFEKYITDQDVLVIKKIIRATAPERIDLPTQSQYTGRRNNRNQTKRVSFRDDLLDEEEAIGAVGFSNLSGTWKNDRCPADDDDSSNPSSEYSDSESSALESGLENDDRVYTWLWRDDNGDWKNYSEEINRKLEKAYRRKPEGTCVISHNGQAERVLFKGMKQRNSTLKKERDIQRLEVDPEMMKQLKSSLFGD